MAKCRSYIRGLSISITVLLLVFGVVMMGVGFSLGYGGRQLAELDQWSRSHGLLVLRVFGPITVVLSVLGICAATTDIKPLLLVFSALTFLEFVALMVVASPLIHLQAQMDSHVEQVFVNATPLFRAEPEFQTDLKNLQASDACCGLRSFSDWEDQIPVSCLCPPPSPCPPLSECQTDSRAGNSTWEGPCVPAGGDPAPSQLIWVHSKPCGPILKWHLSSLIKVSIGVISAFATVMMAAIALSLVLGLEEHWRTPPVETTVDDFDRVKYQPKPSLT
ncbi:23 kDa integral membrane protein-like [Myripristis murdjan]|uniref:23 kDa integral membrane protein-like n=1 Tax=Myripristis murdjan TaxID=586833 RepID=UPI001175E4C8|nr:23 kDa integral membrane protein-like [Myripristis murdjan]